MQPTQKAGTTLFNDLSEDELAALGELHNKDLHEVLERNQFLMPQLTSKICDKPFMLGVASGQIHVPKMCDVRLRNLCSPPPPAVIFEETQHLLNGMGANLNIIDKRPDMNFVLALLTTLAPNK